MYFTPDEVLEALRREKADVFGEDGGVDCARFVAHFRVGDYVEIVRRVREAGDAAALAADPGFRRAFGGFFRLNAARIAAEGESADVYFGELPGLKAEFDRDPARFRRGRAGTYRNLLGRLRAMRDDYVERSFASKLIAAVDATAPIIDRHVSDYLREKFPNITEMIGGGGGIGAAVNEYRVLEDLYGGDAAQSRSAEWFRGNLPEEYRGDVTDVKALDFIVWKLFGR